MSTNYQIARLSEIAPVQCPCGQTRRAFTNDPDQVASLHVVDVTDDARTHYHKRLTEIYYILEGSGQMELDGDLYAVQAGDSESGVNAQSTQCADSGVRCERRVV